MDIQALIAESDKLTADLVTYTETAYNAEERYQMSEANLEEKKAKFYLQEGSIDPPGGGRWNDNKREAFISDKYGDLVSRVKADQEQVKIAEQNIKLTSIRISGLNRKIRLLELANAVSAQ